MSIGFNNAKSSPPSADQLAEFLSVGHEERLHQTIDEPSRRDEQKELVLVPATVGTNRIGVLKQNQIETDIHQRPADTADALQQEIGAERHVTHQAVACKRQKHTVIARVNLR